MKKLVSVMLGLVLIVLLSGCGGSNNDQSTLDRIKNSGTITIGTNSGYPPFQFFDTRNGGHELVGFDIELGNLIAEKLGVEVVWNDMAFDALIPSLASGQIDMVLAGMSATPERAQTIDFSVPYLTSTQMIVAPQATINNINSINELSGKTIVVQNGTTQQNVANAINEQVNNISVMPVPATADMIANVITGQADMMIISSNVAKQLIAANPGLASTTIEGLNEVNLDQVTAAGIGQNSPELTALVNELFQQLIADGTIDKLYQEAIDLQAAVAQAN